LLPIPCQANIWKLFSYFLVVVSKIYYHNLIYLKIAKFGKAKLTSGKEILYLSSIFFSRKLH